MINRESRIENRGSILHPPSSIIDLVFAAFVAALVIGLMCIAEGDVSQEVVLDDRVIYVGK